MSKGKYSPAMTDKQVKQTWEAYCYNADRQIPPMWTSEMKDLGYTYDQRLHFADYDQDGFDRYGYTAFDKDGNYVGPGEGVDAWGYTEMDYLGMNDDEFDDVCCYGG